MLGAIDPTQQPPEHHQLAIGSVVSLRLLQSTRINLRRGNQRGNLETTTGASFLPIPVVAGRDQAASLPFRLGEAAAITLLYGLVAFRQIVLRRIDGADQLPAFLAKEGSEAA